MMPPDELSVCGLGGGPSGVRLGVGVPAKTYWEGCILYLRVSRCRASGAFAVIFIPEHALSPKTRRVRSVQLHSDGAVGLNLSTLRNFSRLGLEQLAAGLFVKLRLELGKCLRECGSTCDLTRSAAKVPGRLRPQDTRVPPAHEVAGCTIWNLSRLQNV